MTSTRCLVRERERGEGKREADGLTDRQIKKERKRERERERHRETETKTGI